MAAPKKYPDELRERPVRLYFESDPRPVIRRLKENAELRRVDEILKAASAFRPDDQPMQPSPTRPPPGSRHSGQAGEPPEFESCRKHQT